MNIRPFSAYRYNPKVAGDPAQLVSPPYDVYDEQMQAEAYDRSHYHFVRLILAREDDPHASAARTLEEWRRKGVLLRENAPAIYPYSQRYITPDRREHVRHGFFALLRLQRPGTGSVFPHERTLAKPLADRLNLMRAARADFGPVFITFADESGDVSRLLSEAHKSTAAVSVPDLEGHNHKLWVQSDGEWQQKLVDAMARIDGVIADGHHRYKAALAYAEEQHALDTDQPSAFKLVAFFPAFEGNVTVLPIHRLVDRWPQDADPSRYFESESARDWVPAAIEQFVARTPATIGMLADDGTAEIWRYRADAPYVWDGSPSELYRRLPTAAFEASVLRGLLAMSRYDIGDKKGLGFVKSAAEAAEMLEDGFVRAFILPPTPVNDIIAVARAGELMPQKSTYFYPKVLSGLVSYVHE